MASSRSPVRPVTDVVFLCGGAALAAFASVWFVESAAVHAGTLAVTTFLSAAHVGASLLRARRARMLRVTVPAFAGALALSAVVVSGGAAFFDVLFLLLAVALPAHVALQSFRAATVIALQAGGQAQRASFTAAAVAGAVGSALAILTGPREVLMLRGPLGVSVGTALWAAACVACVIAALRGARGTNAPLRVVLALTLPPLLAGAPLLFGATVPADWALTGPLSLLHAVQLLTLAAILEPRVARLEERSFDPVAHFGIALALGCALLIDLPLVSARLASLDPTTVLLAVSACVTLAHALVDVHAWSLHDPTLLRAAGDSVVPATHGRHQVSNLRALAVSLPVAAVLGLAAFEPIQVGLIQRGDDDSLALARLLFPSDARVLVADARRAIAEDDNAGARALLAGTAGAVSVDALRLRTVLCVDASAAEPEGCFSALGSGAAGDLEIAALHMDVLLQRGRFEAAVSRARTVLDERPDDPHALALLGTALARAGSDDARKLLDRALAAADEIEPAPPQDSDDDDDDDDDAPPQPTDARALLDPVMARASAELGRIARMEGRRDEARLRLDAAGQSAATLGLADLALFVFAELARLEDSASDARKSLDSWRVALAAARDARDPGVEVAAWLDLLALLERSAASAQDRYVCVAGASRAFERIHKAHEGRGALQMRLDSERARVVALTTAGERGDVDKDLDAAIGAVLSLTYPAPDGALVDDAAADKNPSP